MENQKLINETQSFSLSVIIFNYILQRFFPEEIIMTNPLREMADANEDKFFALFNQDSGRLSYEDREGEKGLFLEIKVLNEEAKLAGIVWFFGAKRAYIEDIRLLVARKQNQPAPFILVAFDGTTSAGKKLLKEEGIPLIKNLDDIQTKTKKKKKKKKVSKESKEVVSIEDDVSPTEIAESPLVKLAIDLIKTLEPEIIHVKRVKGFEEEIKDVRGYTSNNQLIAIYRTIDSPSIGVKMVRALAKYAENENVPLALIVPDKFTPTAKKEATEKGINLISMKEHKASQGSKEVQKLNERLRAGAHEILKQRNYKVINKSTPEFMRLEAGNESLGTYVLAENEKGETILALIPSEDVVRVATVREFKKQMDMMKVSEGMLIPLRRFTYTAEREARENGILLLKRNHPVFNIFNHFLVPEHEIMTREEIDEMLKKYNAKLPQLPKIYKDDPAIVAINGQVGDVVRIIRGVENYYYRLIIPRTSTEVTESSAIANMIKDRN